MKFNTLFFVIVIAVFSCSDNKKTDPNIEYINPNELELSPIKEDNLSAEQISRIKAFHDALGEVNISDIKTTINNFKRDLNPESEIIIWEEITRVYVEEVSLKNNLTIDEKKEIFNLLLMRSMMPSEEVWQQLESKLTILNRERATSIMSKFGNSNK